MHKRLFSGMPEELEPMTDLALEGARFRMHVETRRYGKNVTVLDVEGWPGEEIARLAHDLKHHIGTGGTRKRDSVELQGDHRKRVREFLSAQGYDVEE